MCATRQPAAKPTLAGQRVVVTGGAGFIGSHVVDRLLARGASVAVIDDLSTGRLDNLATAFRHGLAETDVHLCDIRSADCAVSIRRCRPDLVVHLAAQVSVSAANRSPLIDCDVNIRGTVNVLDAAVKAGARQLVYAASCAIYGRVAPDQLPVTEQAPVAPVSPYGLSKAAALHYLGWFSHQRALPFTALALGNVYGPRQSGRECGVIAHMIADIARGAAPVVSGDGAQTRDFVHVRDVAAAVEAACTCDAGGLVNIASGAATTINDVLRLVSTSSHDGLPHCRARPATCCSTSPRRAGFCIGSRQCRSGKGSRAPFARHSNPPSLG
jgi:UDP-glucose 4-epimerase